VIIGLAGHDPQEYQRAQQRQQARAMLGLSGTDSFLNSWWAAGLLVAIAAGAVYMWNESEKEHAGRRGERASGLPRPGRPAR